MITPPSTEVPTSPDHTDMLRSIFQMQADLNNYIFAKQNLRTSDGKMLTMANISSAVDQGCLGVNELPNEWLGRYTKAIEDELRELQQDLLWKWWSKDALNLQNVRIELVDMLHFLVSAFISSGMTPDQLYAIYKQKHAANVARQDSGYSMKTKTEADNLRIQ